MTPQERIKADAERLYRGKPDSHFPSNFKYIEGYIAGATAENSRAQEELKDAQEAAKMFCNKQTVTATQLAELVDNSQVLVDALQQIIDNTEHEDYGSTHESCAVCIAEHALRKWKEEGDEG